VRARRPVGGRKQGEDEMAGGGVLGDPGDHVERAGKPATCERVVDGWAMRAAAMRRTALGVVQRE